MHDSLWLPLGYPVYLCLEVHSGCSQTLCQSKNSCSPLFVCLPLNGKETWASWAYHTSQSCCMVWEMLDPDDKEASSLKGYCGTAQWQCRPQAHGCPGAGAKQISPWSLQWTCWWEQCTRTASVWENTCSPQMGQHQRGTSKPVHLGNRLRPRVGTSLAMVRVFHRSQKDYCFLGGRFTAMSQRQALQNLPN